MSITWEKGAGNGKYYGYTPKDVETEDTHTYKIESFTDLTWCQNNNYVTVPCYSMAEAQKMANIIEGGKNVQ